MTEGAFGLNSFFDIEREVEMGLFRQLLEQSQDENNAYGHILYLYGISGVGKSSVLDQYSRYSKNAGYDFLLMNGRDAAFSLKVMINKLYQAIGVEYPAEGLHSANDVLYTCAVHLNKQAKDRSFILAIDSYEYLMDQDRTICEILFGVLNVNILIVVTSTNPLPVTWLSSFHRRRRTKVYEVEPFSYKQVEQLLAF
jgi:Cdc6-like AAA superfamily ATPase